MENVTLSLHQFTKIKKPTDIPSQDILTDWKDSDVHDIYLLEKKCWAPWLQKSKKDFLTIATNFSNLQRSIKNKNGTLLAFMTTNRINWDGNSNTMPTWDKIAGGAIGSSDFTKTYISTGNTLCLMSMNVNPIEQGKGHAQKLIQELKRTAKELNIQHIICSLRPVGYGHYKLAQIQKNEPLLSFIDYCSLKNEKNEPYDPWLRSASHQGIKLLCTAKDAIVVKVDKKTFENFIKNYKPHIWSQVSNNTWECGETGSWFVDNDCAIYREDNLSVEIPVDF